MKIKYGKGTTEFGPGVSINLNGEEIATAIDAYLVAHNVIVVGPRTIVLNGQLCEKGEVYVDPSGFVIADGKKSSGRGYRKEEFDGILNNLSKNFHFSLDKRVSI